MHYLYEKQIIEGGFRLKRREERSLAGRNRGMIPHLLEIHLDGAGDEPLRWHFALQDVLNHSRWPGSALIIDLKPSGPRISLYEVVEAWGVSERDWTPIMLRLRGLAVDKNSAQFDPADFVAKREEIDDPVFTMMYMNGTVKNGELVGGWTFPPSSSTNSVLLWPKTFEYFAEEARKIIHGPISQVTSHGYLHSAH